MTIVLQPWEGDIVPGGDGVLRSAFPDGGVPIYSDDDYPPIPDSINPATELHFDADALTDGDGSSGDPWNDLDTVFGLFLTEAKSSGAKTLTMQGTATVTVTIDLDVAAYYAEGTAGSPIIIRAHPTNGCTLNQTGGVILFEGQKRLLIYGFSGTAVSGLFKPGSNITNTDYFTFRDLTYTISTGGDNTGIIAADAGNSVNPICDYIGVFNSNIVGPGGAAHANSACIYMSRVPHFRVENNEIGDAPVPFYYKHYESTYLTPDSQYFRNNWIKDAVGKCKVAATGGTYTNNIIESSWAFEATGGGDSGNSSDNLFEHNNCVGNFNLDESDAGAKLAQGNSILNNIIPIYGILINATTASTNTGNYNLISGDILYQNDAARTVAQWQAASVPAGQEADSIQGSPTYTVGSPTTIAGYQLTGGSLGYLGASDGTDIGANIALVGNK